MGSQNWHLILDMTPALFNKLLQFIYSDKCQFEDSIEEILMAPDKYDIPDLNEPET
jgi:hypothetical protein